MPELKFTSAQDYLNYDFDDNFCFFYEEQKEFMESIKRIDPDQVIFIDFEQKFADIIFDLFKRYDALIIDTDQEKLFGEINGERFFLKDGNY